MWFLPKSPAMREVIRLSVFVLCVCGLCVGVTGILSEQEGVTSSTPHVVTRHPYIFHIDSSSNYIRIVNIRDVTSVSEEEGRGRGRVVWETVGRGNPFILAAHSLWDRHTAIVNGNYNVSEDVRVLSSTQSIDHIAEGSLCGATGEREEEKVKEKEREREREGGRVSREPLVCIFGSLLSSSGFLISRYSLSFSLQNSLLSFSLSLSPHPPTNRLIVRFVSPEDEGIYGLGHQYTLLNMKGWRVPIVVSEQGVGRGLQPLTDTLNNGTGGSGGSWHTTYAPKPIYVTNHNRSLALSNSEFSFFDFTDRGVVSIELWGLSMNGFLIACDSLAEVIQNVTSITGRMKPLPMWSQKGAVVGLEGGEDYVTHIVDQLKEQNVPMSAIWLQDWVGMRHSPIDGDRLIWNWELNPDQYPHWHKMVAGWLADGVRVMNYVNPFFSDPTNLTSSYRRNMAQEGLDNHYFVFHPDGTPYQMSSLTVQFYMLDPTNPDAVAWMKQIIKDEVIARPLSSGWMCDFGEYLPMDSRLFSGVDPVTYHNMYPQAWAEIVQSAVTEAIEEGTISSDEIVFFVRAAWTQSPAAVPLFW
jgi:hypothetical protein